MLRGRDSVFIISDNFMIDAQEHVCLAWENNTLLYYGFLKQRHGNKILKLIMLRGRNSLADTSGNYD